MRERREDIPLLARHFADRQAVTNGLPRTEFSADAMQFLSRLPYPGNIDDLKNLVERTILVSGKPLLDASDFDAQYIRHDDARVTEGAALALSLIHIWYLHTFSFSSYLLQHRMKNILTVIIYLEDAACHHSFIKTAP